MQAMPDIETLFLVPFLKQEKKHWKRRSGKRLKLPISGWN